MSELPEETLGALSAMASAERDEHDLPSLVAAGFVDADVVWSDAIGEYAALEGAAPDFGRQYRIGSITKTFTAVAVMRLRAEGRLHLSDRVESHLAYAPFGDHSIRGLLAHNSGLPSEPAGSWWERTRGVGRNELFLRNASASDVFGAGERYHYSNLAYGLLGAVVEELSGQSWFDYVTTYLLNPLELADTTYLPRQHAAQGTSRTPAGRLVAEPATDTRAMAPAGQLWSTVGDLARWGHFLAVGHPDVLDRGSLVQMQTVQSGDPAGQHLGAYGLGHQLVWTPTGTLVGHAGSMPGFLAALFVDVRTRTGAAVVVNATAGARPKALTERLVAELNDAVSTREGVGTELTDVGSEPLLARVAFVEGVDSAELAGSWYWGNTELTAEATDHGFGLSGQNDAWSFRTLARDSYLGLNGYHAGETLTVHRDETGIPAYLEVATFVLTRLPYDPASPIPGGAPPAL